MHSKSTLHFQSYHHYKCWNICLPAFVWTEQQLHQTRSRSGRELPQHHWFTLVCLLEMSTKHICCHCFPLHQCFQTLPWWLEKVMFYSVYVVLLMISSLLWVAMPLFIDASYATHANLWSYTGGAMSWGVGILLTVFEMETKAAQKLKLLMLVIIYIRLFGHICSLKLKDTQSIWIFFSRQSDWHEDQKVWWTILLSKIMHCDVQYFFKLFTALLSTCM